MNPLKHECAFPKCGKLVAPDMLMCRSHWFRVPKAHRVEVWAAWEQYQSGVISLGELRTVQERATLAAVAASQVAAGARVKDLLDRAALADDDVEGGGL